MAKNNRFVKYSIEQLRDYAGLFSSQTCIRSLRFDDVEDYVKVFSKYDSTKFMNTGISVWDYLSKIYRILKVHFRNEYVYKNELLNELYRRYGRSDTIVINEFNLGRSVADLAMFNGSSKAFEIKSELDSNKRLDSQINTYSALFEECYIVVPEKQRIKYESLVDEHIGIILFCHSDRGRIVIKKIKNASHNEKVDIDVLMSTVRTDEYKWMVKTHYGSLPPVSCFQMFDTCKEMLSVLTSDELHRLFNDVIKRRKSVFSRLSDLPKPVRQMVLGLNPTPAKLDLLNILYNCNLNN